MKRVKERIRVDPSFRDEKENLVMTEAPPDEFHMKGRVNRFVSIGHE
jgi:hypothetical protein